MLAGCASLGAALVLAQVSALTAPNLVLVELKDASTSEKRGQNLTARFVSIPDNRKVFDVCFPSHSFTPKEREIISLIRKSIEWSKPDDVHEPHPAIAHPRFRIPETAGGYTTDFSQWIIVKDSANTSMTEPNSTPANSNTPNTRDQLESLRKHIPEGKTLSEQNGISIQSNDGATYTLTRLESASRSVSCNSIADCETLMRYLEDTDLKIRFIAASVLERELKAHPNGMSLAEIEGKRTDLHKNLLDRFKSKINQKFKPKSD